MGLLLKRFVIVSARYLRAVVFTCLNLEVAYNVGVGVLATYLTSKSAWNIRYRLDSFFVSLAIITPLMSIITLAFTRRERAANNMAILKANCLTFYLMHRDQHKDPPGSLETVGDNEAKHAKEVAALTADFLNSVDKYLVQDGVAYESHAEVMLGYLPYWNWMMALLRNEVNFRPLVRQGSIERVMLRKEMALMSGDLMRCYQKLTHMAMWNEKTIVKWGFLKPGENAPPGRSNTILGSISAAFESLRLIRDYRTPVMLRYGVRILVYIYAVFMGPYFNDTCSTFESYEAEKAKRDRSYEPGMCYVNYICAVLFLMSVTLLMRIGRDIEYPFDMKGIDDLFFQGAEEFLAFTKVQVDPAVKQAILDGSLHLDFVRAGTMGGGNDGE